MNSSLFVVLIPARNEQTTVADIVHSAHLTNVSEVIVIDDASSDATAERARAAGATVLSLAWSLGAWGATQAGLRYALSQGYSNAITMDADGQHLAGFIDSLLQPLQTGQADIVIGAFPQRASQARRLAWRWFRLLTGLRIADITSGFRAYGPKAIELLAGPAASLLDYQDVGVLLILRGQNLRLVEVPVTMELRCSGKSRVFNSWFIVGKYMLQTSILCLARIGHKG